MSFLVKDVRCPDGHYECSVLVERGGEPTPCPTCGKPRTTFFATREQEGLAAAAFAAAQVGTFRTTKLDGEVFHDQASLDRHIDSIARRHKVDRSEVQMTSTSGGNVRRDEMRHTAWEMRKADGFDTPRYESYKQEQRRLTAERKERRRG